MYVYYFNAFCFFSKSGYFWSCLFFAHKCCFSISLSFQNIPFVVILHSITNIFRTLKAYRFKPVVCFCLFINSGLCLHILDNFVFFTMSSYFFKLLWESWGPRLGIFPSRKILFLAPGGYSWMDGTKVTP